MVQRTAVWLADVSNIFRSGVGFPRLYASIASSTLRSRRHAVSVIPITSAG